MHLTDYLITLVSVCVSVHRSVVERLRPQFFTDYHQILYAAWKYDRRPLLFLRQTGSRLPILEMCKSDFGISWQFRDCGGHIFAPDRHEKHELSYN